VNARWKNLAILEDKLVDVEIQNASSELLRILANATPFLPLLGVWPQRQHR
jgi:hypothetical protein